MTTMSKKLIRLPDVPDAVVLSERTRYLYGAAGVFPKPVKIGSLPMWAASDIEAWVDNRIAERDAA